MDEDIDVGLERVVETLLVALATQAAETHGGRLSPAAIRELADSHRSIIRMILGSTGHLIHYGEPSGAGPSNALFAQLISSLRSLQAPGSTGLRPGDLVELVRDHPEDALTVGTLMRICYVGGNGTVDVGHRSPAEEYLLFTLPIGDVRPAQR